MGLKLGCSYWGKNVGWRCLRNGPLRRIFGVMTDGEKEELRKLRKSRLMISTAQPIFFGWEKSISSRSVGHIACMGEERSIQGFGGAIWEKETSWETQTGMGRKYKDENSVNVMWGYGLDRAGFGYRQVAGTCECGNEPSGSIKCAEFSVCLKKKDKFWRRTVLCCGIK